MKNIFLTISILCYTPFLIGQTNTIEKKLEVHNLDDLTSFKNYDNYLILHKKSYNNLTRNYLDTLKNRKPKVKRHSIGFGGAVNISLDISYYYMNDLLWSAKYKYTQPIKGKSNYLYGQFTYNFNSSYGHANASKSRKLVCVELGYNKRFTKYENEYDNEHAEIYASLGIAYYSIVGFGPIYTTINDNLVKLETDNLQFVFFRLGGGQTILPNLGIYGDLPIYFNYKKNSYPKFAVGIDLVAKYFF